MNCEYFLLKVKSIFWFYLIVKSNFFPFFKAGIKNTISFPSGVILFGCLVYKIYKFILFLLHYFECE